ncbi:hypothetical protein ACTJKQ_14270 [Acidovorax sp. 22279]|uniref:hypothetical protein n=1 Tax=Acidovorax sp. 22279 TaxID=3453900 RepID=UPI003F850143
MKTPFFTSSTISADSSEYVAPANANVVLVCSSFMSTPSGNGCVRAAILSRKRAGTYRDDLFALHGSKSPFFAFF